MSKLKILLVFCFLYLLLFKLPNNAFAAAAACELTTDPASIVIPGDGINPKDPIKYLIKVADQNDEYEVVLQEGGWFGIGYVGWRNTKLDGGHLKDGGKELIKGPKDFGGMGIFKEGTHQIIVKRSGSEYCSLTYSINKDLPNNQQITCSIFGPKSPDSSSVITLKGNITPPGKYRFWLPLFKDAKRSQFDINNDANIPDQNLGVFPPGSFQVLLQMEITPQTPDPYGNYIPGWENTNCLISNLNIRATDPENPADPAFVQIGSGKPGSGIVTPAKICTPEDIRNEKCTSGGGQIIEGCNGPNDKNNPGIATAIGCIHTNPTELIKDLMKFIIGISGGLAFLMMLLGAFQMLTSAGNPETLSAGRDRLTSAVIGLLFVIFAILLLQIIGVDILKIPGFGR